jgi:hypothetical protein
MVQALNPWCISSIILPTKKLFMKKTTCVLLGISCLGLAIPSIVTAADPPAPAAAAPAPAAQVTIPAGTTIMVRLVDGVSSASKAGSPFSAKLETDLGGPTGVAAKAGATVYGKVQSSSQAGRAKGQSTLDLRLTQIVVNGQQVPVMTSGYVQSGARSGKKVAKGAAAGAAIGAAAGDAGKGAAIGATAGAAKKGEAISVAPGTLLEFTLTQPVTVPAAH